MAGDAGVRHTRARVRVAGDASYDIRHTPHTRYDHRGKYDIRHSFLERYDQAALYDIRHTLFRKIRS